MTARRHVKLFRKGRNQTARIPREFELPGEEVVMHREGGRLVIEAIPATRTLSEVVAGLEQVFRKVPGFQP